MNPRLDKFDLAILRELQADGRLSNAELAARVGLSAAPCWRRVRALEEAGFITGYRAILDRQKIGLGVLAFVRLDAERPEVDVFRRDAGGHWVLHPYGPGEEVALASVGLTVPMAMIYEDVRLDAAQPFTAPITPPATQAVSPG